MIMIEDMDRIDEKIAVNEAQKAFLRKLCMPYRIWLCFFKSLIPIKNIVIGGCNRCIVVYV